MDALERKPVVVMAALLRPSALRHPLRKAQQLLVHQECPLERGIGHRQRGPCGFRLRADHGPMRLRPSCGATTDEFNRKSALDIVRRWAPAECNVATGIGGIAMLAVRGRSEALFERSISRRAGKRAGLCGIRRKPGPAASLVVVSMVIPMAPKTPQYRVPSIAEGMGEKPKPANQPEPAVARRKPVQDQSPTASAGSKPAAKVQMAAACPSEEQRHPNYAAGWSRYRPEPERRSQAFYAEDGTPIPTSPT